MINPAEADRRAWRLDRYVLAAALGAPMLLLGWLIIAAADTSYSPRAPALVAGTLDGIKLPATPHALPQKPQRVYAIANPRRLRGA